MLAVWFAVVVVFAVAVEGLARLAVPAPGEKTLAAWRHTMAVLGASAINEASTFDPYLFWVLKPNLRDLRVAGTSPEGDRIDFAFSTNALGLRGREVTPKGQRMRVLAIGDSCTFGLGVNDADAWPAQLQCMLDENGGGAQWDVINAGVYGYSAFQGLRYLERMGFALKPDVIIVQFWANDAERWSLSDREVARRLALTRWEAPLMRSRFYCWLKQTMQRTDFGRILAPDGPVVRESVDEFAQTLRAIRDSGTTRGIKTLFVEWPVREQVQRPPFQPNAYQRAIEGIAAETNAPLVNPYQQFLIANSFPYVDPVHASRTGCALVASDVMEALARLYPGALTLPPPESSASSVTGGGNGP